MKAISAAVAALSVVSILACEPVLQPEANSPNFANGGGGGVVEKVTGSGHFTRGGPHRTPVANQPASGARVVPLVVGRRHRRLREAGLVKLSRVQLLAISDQPSAVSSAAGG